MQRIRAIYSVTHRKWRILASFSVSSNFLFNYSNEHIHNSTQFEAFSLHLIPSVVNVIKEAPQCCFGYDIIHLTYFAKYCISFFLLFSLSFLYPFHFLVLRILSQYRNSLWLTRSVFCLFVLSARRNSLFLFSISFSSK